MIPADTGGVSAWQEDVNLRRHFGQISDKAFYRENPELAPFDNGKGFWTAGLNRNVKRQEFVEYGRRILKQEGKRLASDPEAFQAAAKKLLKILEGRGAHSARLYIHSVLEQDVAAELLKIGGKEFYTPYFPKSFSRSGYSDNWRKCNWLYSYPRDCADYQNVSWDGNRLTVSDCLSGDYHSPDNGARIPACPILTTTFALDDETRPGRFNGEIWQTYYARTEEGEILNQRLYYRGELGTFNVGEAGSELLEGVFGINFWRFDSFYLIKSHSDDMDFLWRASILISYLALRSVRLK